MKLAGLEWQKHQKIISAHYSFDQFSGTTLTDSSGNSNDGTLVGGPKWVEVKIFLYSVSLCLFIASFCLATKYLAVSCVTRILL